MHISDGILLWTEYRLKYISYNDQPTTYEYSEQNLSLWFVIFIHICMFILNDIRIITFEQYWYYTNIEYLDYDI